MNFFLCKNEDVQRDNSSVLCALLHPWQEGDDLGEAVRAIRSVTHAWPASAAKTVLQSWDVNEVIKPFPDMTHVRNFPAYSCMLFPHSGWMVSQSHCDGLDGYLLIMAETPPGLRSGQCELVCGDHLAVYDTGEKGQLAFPAGTSFYLVLNKGLRDLRLNH